MTYTSRRTGGDHNQTEQDKFKNPMQWADGVEYMGPPKILFSKYYDRYPHLDCSKYSRPMPVRRSRCVEKIQNNALKQASAELQYVPARPRQVRLDIEHCNDQCYVEHPSLL